MALKSTAVTVTTAATRLDSEPTSATHQSKQSVAFKNESASTVYFGGADVTVANGTPVPAGEWSPGYDLGQGEQMWGIVASGTAEVRVSEQGV